MQLTSCGPVVPHLKLCYNRFTQSRIATAYFILALLNCLTQIVLQIQGFQIEHSQAVHIHNIKDVGNVKEKFAILDSSDSILICHAIPGHTSDPQPCERFDASGLASSNSLNASLNACSEVLAWPAQLVHQAIREYAAMTVLQPWLFVMSIVAIIAESIPHVVAGLVTQLLSTAWSSFHIHRTKLLEQRFNTLVTFLACHDVDPIPNYWESKLNNQISILVLNAVSLLVSVFLSWKLCKHFGTQSFTRVGGSKRIHHLYLLMLAQFVCLQLATFFLIISLVLWIEQLFDGPIASLANKQTVYLAGFIVTAVMIIPWRYLGWTAVRREHRRLMIVFLCTSIFLIVSQMGMFISPIYRLTFATWSFFGCITVIAYVLLNISFLAALVCRYFFGRGLAHFLHVQEALDECDFTPVYIERGSGKFEHAKVPEGGTMPWDVEGMGVVKKISLPLDNNHDGIDLSSMKTCSPRGSLCLSCSQATDSRSDPSIILDTATISKIKRTDTTNESGVVASSGPPSHKSGVSSKSTRQESSRGGDSIRSENNVTRSIRRERGFSLPPVRTQSLVGLASNVKEKPGLPSLSVTIPSHKTHV